MILTTKKSIIHTSPHRWGSHRGVGDLKEQLGLQRHKVTESCCSRLVTDTRRQPVTDVVQVATWDSDFLVDAVHRPRVSTTSGTKTLPTLSTLVACLPSLWLSPC